MRSPPCAATPNGAAPLAPLANAAAAREALDDAVDLARWRAIEANLPGRAMNDGRWKTGARQHGPASAAGRQCARSGAAIRSPSLLRALDFDYIALTPGASFRGLHDSLVNYLGNTRPEMLLCIHEEHAVALAHG